MTKIKKNKRALLASLLAMLLCVAMLIGSTFAWFTDSVVSGKNKVAAGNLDVELEHAVFNDDGSFKEWKPVGSETPLFDENALWEPGYTQVAYLKVSNVGSLSLDYKLSVDVANERRGLTIDENGEKVFFKLSDSLEFGVVETVTQKFFDDRDDARDALGETGDLNHFVTGSIKASEKETNVKYIAVVVYMPEDVGNEANHVSGVPTAVPSIELGVKLEATQMVDEHDSFGNDYDISANSDYDAYAEADAEALRKSPLNAYRKADGTYGKINSSDESSFLLDIARQGGEATLIRNIGAPERGVSSQQTNYSNKQSVLDLHGNTYTSGGIEMKQSAGTKTDNSSLVIKNGTMVSSINSQDILKSYNAMQTVTLDHVNLKWDTPLAWDADHNYRGLNLSANTVGAVFTVNDSVLDCNASLYTNSLPSDPDECVVANITNTVVNGRLHGAGLTLNVDGCTVNGEVFCNASNSSKTTVNIKNSFINGNAFFDAAKSKPTNDVTIENTIIDGDLLTNFSRNNVHFTLTDVTVTGTLGYKNMSSMKVPNNKVTIVSGAYGFDPTIYLADGSTAVYNETIGLWVVTVVTAD